MYSVKTIADPFLAETRVTMSGYVSVTGSTWREIGSAYGVWCEP